MIVKKSFNAVITIVLMVVLSSCTDQFQKVPTQKFVIVNVLDKEYFDDCHIKGSINVPFAELKKYALDHWDKEKTEIVVHCSNYSCGASSEGCKILMQLGFKHVWAFEGGTSEAKSFGIEVEGACTQPYLNDYKKPENYLEKTSVKIISVENLKKKIEEFAIKS
jgi:rhodanese-related sulfurtransferase